MDKQSHIIENNHGYPKIFIDGSTESVMTAATDEEFIIISRFESDEITVSPMTSDHMSANDNVRMIDLNTAIWDAALFNPYCEMMEGNNIDSPVKLRSWPLFTRLKFMPFHIKLTKLMAAKPYSLSKIHELTGMPMNDIINFYNATLTAGLIAKPIVEIVPGNTPDQNKKVKSAKKGILAKLTNHLPDIH
jgi:hypothetical protein